MSVLQSILLGIIQGISEFLPVSSSGHLLVLREIMDIDGIPVLYDVLLHVATLLVVMWFFRRRIIEICVSLFRLLRRNGSAEDARNGRLAGILIVGTVFTAGVGLGVRSLPEFASISWTGFMFLLTAAVLVASDFLGTRRAGLASSSPASGGEIRLRSGIIAGLVQGLAVFPGLSRSGSTIAATIASGVPREKAGEFSFLLSIPAIAGAMVLEIGNMQSLRGLVSPAAVVAGFIAAMLVGYASLRLLVHLIKGGKLWVFSLYLVPLALWVLLAL